MSEYIDVLLSFSGTVITLLVIVFSFIVVKLIFNRIEQEKAKKHYNPPGYLSDYSSYWCTGIGYFFTN